MTQLTDRQCQIAILYVRGLMMKEIAHELHISTFTVRHHVRNIYAKAKVNDRTGLTTHLLRSGIARVGELFDGARS